MIAFITGIRNHRVSGIILKLLLNLSSFLYLLYFYFGWKQILFNTMYPTLIDKLWQIEKNPIFCKRSYNWRQCHDWCDLLDCWLLTFLSYGIIYDVYRSLWLSVFFQLILLFGFIGQFRLLLFFVRTSNTRFLNLSLRCGVGSWLRYRTSDPNIVDSIPVTDHVAGDFG
jgi:hypothetical protein